MVLQDVSLLCYDTLFTAFKTNKLDFQVGCLTLLPQIRKQVYSYFQRVGVFYRESCKEAPQLRSCVKIFDTQLKVQQ